LIPVLALTLLKITNDKSLMGQYTNGWFTNTVMILLVLLAVYFTFLNGMDLWNQLEGIF
jgi:Mn2+/Fe2+ NRAMP family transporter